MIRTRYHFLISVASTSVLRIGARTVPGSHPPSADYIRTPSSERSTSNVRLIAKPWRRPTRRSPHEVKAHSELVKNLEYLTTQIGPRLTGSPQMQAASQWTLKRFQDYGVDAHLETTEIAHGWTRGTGNCRNHQSHPDAHRHSCLRLEQSDQGRDHRQRHGAEHHRSLQTSTNTKAS